MAKTEKYYGTGRRKKSIARVYLVPGKGDVKINKRSMDEYFGLETLKVIVRQPLTATETADKFDVIVNVRGGGYTGPVSYTHLDVYKRQEDCTGNGGGGKTGIRFRSRS